MTPEELDRLQTLCDRATDGPWPDVEARDVRPRYRHEGWRTGIRLGHEATGQDAAFIEAARVALPKLLARVRELEEEVRELEESRQQAIWESWGADN